MKQSSHRHVNLRRPATCQDQAFGDRAIHPARFPINLDRFRQRDPIPVRNGATAAIHVPQHPEWRRELAVRHRRISRPTALNRRLPNHAHIHSSAAALQSRTPRANVSRESARPIPLLEDLVNEAGGSDS